ncbi:MAG: heme lyase CcmF/NrfE family subunit [Anaerolineales bacterium]|nr:heme lyase CcmF/NrfE family subunit [Chloroflexota bacterium]MBL6979640.1 heme lyase CcmF/NrfE family subunit [Anaerolineales bacterium]
MIANLGYGALVITFIVSLYGIGASFYGVRQNKPAWVNSARNGMLLTFPLLTLSALSIIVLLITDHYEVEYVASVTSRSMPMYLKITALWGGQAGSLVFWSWLMSAFASAVTLRKWDRDREFLPWVIVVSLITLAFFISLNIFVENPFTRLWQLPSGQVIEEMFQPAGSALFFPRDGQGLNPLLRHPGMIIHPPMLYLGFVSFVIPFAFAIAALVTGRTDDRWIRLTRRWTLWAWMFLSLGLVLGGRWAYDVLGWGGYWGWDPVEIAAFMPWLTGTAFLHSVMIQEKRGMLKQWNMVLVILTYSLVIFGTFLTRSGVLSSVHAFAQSAIGPMFFAFIGITFIGSLSLLFHRWNDLKAKTEMTSMLSREALFLLNNLLFIGILVVCFWGVIFPLISELFTGQKVTVGPPFYERANGPLFAGLLLLMAIAPLSAWGHSTIKTLGRAIWKPAIVSVVAVVAVIVSGITNPYALIGFFLTALVITVTVYEYWRGAMARGKRHGENFFVALWTLVKRNRRRYGGYIIHLSMAMLAIGIIGIEIFQSETQGTLSQGESLALGAYTMTYDSLAVFDAPDGRNVARAVVSINKNGKPVGELYPRRDFFYDSQQPMTIPGVRSTIEDDFYILLVDWEEISTSNATFKVYHNPLVKWMWLGSWLFIFGTLVAAWPEKESDPVPARNRKRVSATVKA